MADITYIHGTQPVEKPKIVPENVVAHLEDLLDRAKAGEVSGGSNRGPRQFRPCGVWNCWRRRWV